MTSASDRAKAATPRSLSGLLPFLRPYRGRIVVALLFLVAAAVTTLAFPVALRKLIDGGLGLTGSAAMSSGASSAAANGERLMALRDHFLALFGVGVALGVFSALRFYSVTWLGERVTADLRNAVYRHVVRQSPAFFETTATGEVLSRLTTDTTLVQQVVGSSLSMGLRNGVMGIGAMVMLIVTNPYVMTQVLGILLLVVAPSMAFGRRVRKLSRASQDRVADSSAIAAEVLNAIPVVQSYVQENREAARFEVSTEHAFDTARKRTKVRSMLVAFIISATFGALLWGLYQGTQAVLAGRITAGHLGETVVYVMLLVSSVAVLSEVYGDLLRAAGATERLMELLAAVSPVTDPASPHTLPPTRAGSAVELRHVQFHYPSRPKHAALADYSLKVRPGETVALVGPSGAGKSTVFQLLLRFYDVGAGAVTVDGVDVRDLTLDSLRGAIGVISQDPFLFSATVRDNIAFGGGDLTDEQVEGFARAAQAHEFIEKLPDGYDTVIGERGITLSGVQRQRIAIARALAVDPRILILDDATASVDATTETRIRNGLREAMRGRTTLIIAHRLSTIALADEVVVLADGRVAARGTHDHLVESSPVYREIYEHGLLEQQFVDAVEARAEVA